jgi:hypothetical protein
MNRLQFRTLYREFLFRLVDLELLSPDAQGDADKLLGRIAGLLGFFSLILGLAGLVFGGKNMSPAAFRNASWAIEHFLISTTMLVVGLFAVFSWDSVFPDLRDVLVLAPLPIRSSTFFLAKVAAAGTGLGLAVGVFNAGPGFTWPVTLSSPNPSFLGTLPRTVPEHSCCAGSPAEPAIPHLAAGLLVSRPFPTTQRDANAGNRAAGIPRMDGSLHSRDHHGDGVYHLLPSYPS